MKIRTFFLSAMALALLGAQPAQAASNILFIVDSSNSMWGQIDGKPKMETARVSLSKLVSDLPSDAKLALMAYGHRREKDCEDVELLSAIGKDTPDMLTKLISSLQPTGKTPIANALTRARDAFKGLEGQSNYIVLVSDGVESCDGDPCAVAKKLQEDGFSVKAHVVGFGLNEGEGKQLTCIAENSGGKYFEASDVTAFNEAVQEVAQLTQKEPEPEPAPAPKEPVAELYFSDDFDGSELGTHWDVVNPNPDQFIVENGNLMLIGKAAGGPGTAEIPNVIKLIKDMPAGDWTMTIEMKVEFQTGRDQLAFGLYDDAQNYIAGNFYGKNDFCCYNSGLALQTIKVAGGEKTMFEREVFPRGTNNYEEYLKTVPGKGKVTLKFVRQGRTYKTMAHLAGHNDEKGNPVWAETDIVTSLRAPKQVMINASQAAEVAGESMFQIESVKIEEMK